MMKLLTVALLFTCAEAQWIKRAKKHCNNHKMAHPYTSLIKAEDACARNKACSGVYDLSCDRAGIFYLCNHNYPFQNSGRSCVYQSRHATKPGGRWIKVARKHCAFHRNGTAYRSMKQAERACIRSRNCSAVYDPNCDGKGTFYACSRGFAYSKSARSCVYTRARGGSMHGCSGTAFFHSCSNDRALNSGNMEKLCAGSCAKFLIKNMKGCMQHPPPGTPKATISTLGKLTRMCRGHH